MFMFFLAFRKLLENGEKLCIRGRVLFCFPCDIEKNWLEDFAHFEQRSCYGNLVFFRLKNLFFEKLK